MERLVKQTKKIDIPHIDDSIFKNPSDMRNKFTFVVDALFGFSFKPPVKQPFDQIIEAVNKSSLPVVSIDIPAGKKFILMLSERVLILYLQYSIFLQPCFFNYQLIKSYVNCFPQCYISWYY